MRISMVRSLVACIEARPVASYGGAPQSASIYCFHAVHTTAQWTVLLGHPWYKLRRRYTSHTLPPNRLSRQSCWRQVLPTRSTLSVTYASVQLVARYTVSLRSCRNWNHWVICLSFCCITYVAPATPLFQEHGHKSCRHVRIKQETETTFMALVGPFRQIGHVQYHHHRKMMTEARPKTVVASSMWSRVTAASECCICSQRS